MKGQGPRSERETVIRFDEAGDTANVWTASAVVYRRLKKMGFCPHEDGERSAIFEIPKRCVSLRRPIVTSARRLKALQKARTLAKRRSSENPLKLLKEKGQSGVPLKDSQRP